MFKVLSGWLSVRIANPRLINEYMHRPDVDGFLISHDAIVWIPYIFEESEIVFCTVIS